jgi:hypothetical protein
MYTVRDFLSFFVGAAITAALIVLLLPPSPCGVSPAAQVLALDNENLLADHSLKELHTVDLFLHWKLTFSPLDSSETLN